MRENNRKPIEKCRRKLPQFTTMNVIDGQAGLMSYSSLIFYSLTIDNILNIIVLLILAGVSIATLTGENGILTRANDAKVETRGAAVEEEKDLWKANKLANEYSNGDVETLTELLERIGPNGSKLLTQEEVDEIKETGQTEIGSRTIVFGMTIGNIYDDNLIGQKVTYESNGQSNWIIFGKDESGNVLLTTETPIDNGFNLTSGAESWLRYEDNLKAACSGYGRTIQGKTVTSRSITMEDINYVTGFDVDSLNFDTYTFGENNNYAKKEVNYYFPSLEASANGYWQQPTSDKTFTHENDWYVYGQMEGQFIYSYSGEPDGADATSLIKNPDKLKYILGEDGSYEYLVASRSVGVYSYNAFFYVAGVGDSGVLANYYCLCYSDSDGGYADGDGGSRGVRPIVVLPSDIEVEKNESGQWDIAY